MNLQDLTEEVGSVSDEPYGDLVDGISAHLGIPYRKATKDTLPSHIERSGPYIRITDQSPRAIVHCSVGHRYSSEHA